MIACRRRPHRRGMSLVEMLVTCALVGLLFGIVSMTLRSGLSAWRRSQTRADLQGNALVTLHAVSNAILHAHADDLQVFPRRTRADDGRESEADALAVSEPLDEHADEGASPAPASVSATLVYYMKTDARELWLARIEPPSGTDASAGAAIPPTVITALESGAEVPQWIGTHRRVARFVERLHITTDGSRYRVWVVTEEKDKATRCSLETAVTPIIESLNPRRTSATR